MAMATYKQKVNVWIGLNDLRTNNQWLWQDNSKVIYTHWDKGEPTSSHSHAKTKDTVSKYREGNDKNRWWMGGLPF